MWWCSAPTFNCSAMHQTVAQLVSYKVEAVAAICNYQQGERMRERERERERERKRERDNVKMMTNRHIFVVRSSTNMWLFSSFYTLIWLPQILIRNLTLEYH